MKCRIVLDSIMIRIYIKTEGSGIEKCLSGKQAIWQGFKLLKTLSDSLFLLNISLGSTTEGIDMVCYINLRV